MHHAKKPTPGCEVPLNCSSVPGHAEHPRRSKRTRPMTSLYRMPLLTCMIFMASNSDASAQYRNCESADKRVKAYLYILIRSLPTPDQIWKLCLSIRSAWLKDSSLPEAGGARRAR